MFSERMKVYLSRRNLLFTIDVLSLCLFLITMGAAITNVFLFNLDASVSDEMESIQDTALTLIMVYVTETGSILGITVVSTLFISFLLYKKEKILAVFSTFTIVGGFLLEYMVKEVVRRPRPTNSLVYAAGYSFPSGHATMISILFLLILYVVSKRYKKMYKPITILAVSMVALVGFSRIYLGAHWLSDVVGGFTLAVSWISTMLVLFEDYFSIHMKSLSS